MDTLKRLFALELAYTGNVTQVAQRLKISASRARSLSVDSEVQEEVARCLERRANRLWASADRLISDMFELASSARESGDFGMALSAYKEVARLVGLGREESSAPPAGGTAVNLFFGRDGLDGGSIMAGVPAIDAKAASVSGRADRAGRLQLPARSDQEE